MWNNANDVKLSDSIADLAKELAKTKADLTKAHGEIARLKLTAFREK